MKTLGKYAEFNLDLSRMFDSAIQRNRIKVPLLAVELGFTNSELDEILNWPVRAPSCNFAKVVERLGLVSEFYELFFREVKRDRERDLGLH